MLETKLKLILAASILGVLAPVTATAQSDLCDRAAQQAANKTGVPMDVLYALTRTETGRRLKGKLQPWPWTVNMQGKGYWFATKSEALTFVTLHHDAGARSFDVGCFQVNYKWHGQAFQSLSEMFEPVKNATYAAKFLSDLRRDAPDWSSAAGAYHSKTPSLKARYQARFEDIFAAAKTSQPKLPTSRPAEVNRYPLLQESQKPGQMGSLFGGQSGSRKPLFSIEARS